MSLESIIKSQTNKDILYLNKSMKLLVDFPLELITDIEMHWSGNLIPSSATKCQSEYKSVVVKEIYYKVACTLE